MIKLSRTGWNNLIIFAMLFMIFLFNGLHNKLLNSSEQPSQIRLLADNSFVLTMAFKEAKVERIGTGWRSDHNKVINLPELVAFWLNYQSLSIEPSISFNESQLQSEVAVWLAGVEQAQVFELYHADQTYYLYHRYQHAWFKLADGDVNQLFPFFKINK